MYQSLIMWCANLYITIHLSLLLLLFCALNRLQIRTHMYVTHRTPFVGKQIHLGIILNTKEV